MSTQMWTKCSLDELYGLLFSVSCGSFSELICCISQSHQDQT